MQTAIRKPARPGGLRRIRTSMDLRPSEYKSDAFTVRPSFRVSSGSAITEQNEVDLTSRSTTDPLAHTRWGWSARRELNPRLEVFTSSEPLTFPSVLKLAGQEVDCQLHVSAAYPLRALNPGNRRVEVEVLPAWERWRDRASVRSQFCTQTVSPWMKENSWEPIFAGVTVTELARMRACFVAAMSRSKR